MKKITLALLPILALSMTAFSQNYVVQAPPYNGWTSISAPSGNSSQKYQRSVFLVPQSELSHMVLTNSVVTDFGFDLVFGTAVAPVAGNFTVYLQNTTDVVYNKGLNFATALTGMQQSYAGAMTIPLSSGGTTMGVTLTNNFTYTGNGIYVAYDWEAGALNASELNGAFTLVNLFGLNPGGAAVEGSSLPAAATMTTSNYRPVFRFTAGNIASNDVAILRMDALGVASKQANSPQLITTVVKNLSAGTLNNIPVKLAVTGVNSHSSTYTISSLPAGGVATVSFTTFNPTVNGLNTLSITIPSDQNNDNNSYAWSQSVTCSDMANNPPLASIAFSQNAVGVNSGIIASKYTAPATCSLNAIKLAVFNNNINLGKQLYGVLMDAAGNIISITDTLTLTNAMLGTFVNFSFSPAQQFTAGADYFLGVAVFAGPVYPFGISILDPYAFAGSYYLSGINGGPQTPADFGFLGIQAVLGYSATTITASASILEICKNDGASSVTLTATGGSSTYTWTPGGTGASIAVTPTVSGASGLVNYSVTGTDGISGCKSNVASITVSVNACAGLASNTSNGFNIQLFPNPTVNGKSTIAGLTGTNVITIMNTLGQVVATFSVSEETATIDLSNQAVGNYIVKITDSTNQSRMVKLINQN